MFERFRRNKKDAARDERAEGAPREEVRRDTTAEPMGIRGGVTFGGILTGVVVAFGAMFILSALTTGVLVALGVEQGDIRLGDVAQAGIALGIGLVVAQFLSYLWGGYTAGRMGRGSGVANGLLVPLVALIIAVVVAAIAYAVGTGTDAQATFRINLPFDPANVGSPEAQTWGVGLGVAALIAMFVGGALGGWLGYRWHSKLERGAYRERRAAEDRHIDLSERQTTRPTSTRDETAPPAPDRTETRRTG